jgi:hypothetical protein
MKNLLPRLVFRSGFGGVRRWWFVSVCALLVIGGLLFWMGRASDASVMAQGQKDLGKLGEGVQQQIKALLDEKASRTPAQQKLDSQLLYAAKMRRGEPIAAGVRQLSVKTDIDADARTTVDITAIVGGTLIEDLEAAGAEIKRVYARYNSIRALAPIDRLEEIAALPQVRFIQPKQAPQYLHHIERERRAGHNIGEELPPGFLGRSARVRNFLADVLNRLWSRDEKTEKAINGQETSIALGGGKTSEGDAAHRAAAARTTFGANGSGLRIGVLSDSANSLAASQGSGDLPQNVVVLPGQAGVGNDEGTAMLEIIYDLAPGAQLYFATADGGIAQFAQAVRDLRAAGCDIIVDDVSYSQETPFQDGQAPNVVSTTNGGAVWQAVNDVVASGALYFSSAGNEGNKNDNTSGTWQGDFVDGGTLALVPGGTVHNFGGGAQFDLITVTGSFADLFWADPLGGSNNDYDLFILNSAGTAVVASSTNVQNGTQDPYEAADGASANNRLVILKKTGAANRFLYLENFRGRLGTSTEGNIRGHSCAAGAFSVAATPAANAFGAAPNPTGPFPNPFGATNTVEIFSSDGPRRIFFNANGTAITPGNFSASGGSLRQKPDITAADGVTVTGAGGFPTRFFGTSAAAPHAGAIAALLKSAKPSLTPAQVRTALVNTAIDVEGAGIDRDSGAGIVMAFEALQSVGAVASANLQTGTIAATEVGGNSNTFIERGEGSSLVVQLLNTGPVAATGVSATLSTATPGVVVTTANSTYANLAATTGAATNATPFAFNLTASAACPLRVDFVLTVTFTGAGSPKVLPFTVQTGLPPVTITSILDATPSAAGPGFVATTGLQTARLNRDGDISTCGTPKTCPGTTGTGTRRYDAYTFTNCSTAASCITVDLSTTCVGNSQLFVAAYLGSFDPNNICTNYLADPGTSPGAVPLGFSFNVPAGATFTVVVNEINAGGGVGCGYTLDLGGLCCQQAGACPTVSQLVPATSFPGNNLMVAGANLNGVTGVRFASGLPAGFNIVNNSALNVLVPNGATSGPLILDRPGCPDVQTPAFTLASNLSSNNEIAVDDGSMEIISNVTSSNLSYFVNRLTPTAYPTTVTKVAIFFPSTPSAPPSGTPFEVIVGANPGGGTVIDGTKFTATPSTTQPGGAFAVYNVTPLTINSGDFVVGFRIPFVSGVFPAAADISSTVQNRSYISSDGSTFTLTNRNFGFRAATLQGCPNVIGISPTGGPAGTQVTLTGTNLNGVSATKFYNNATAQFTLVSPTQITTTVPNAAATGPITLSKSGCPDMTAPVFAVNAASCLTVSNVNPTSGAVGATVMINGSGFTGASSVKFANNVSAQFTVVSDTQITATVPGGAVTGPITIGKTGCTDAQTASFTVTAACPTVSGINPTNGAVGAQVTINGANFTGVSAVKFAGNVTASFTVISDTQFTATVPNGAVTGAITISKPNCADVQTTSFTVTTGCPTVGGITPTGGAVGAQVTIAGANFTGVTAVKFANNVTAQFTVGSATQITATVPAGAVNGPITISKAGCADVQTTAFTVQAGNCSASTVELKVDDGGFEDTIGLVTGGTDYAVNRLTPTSYPATLTGISIFWPSGNGVTAGMNFSLLVGVNPSGSSGINGVTLQSTAATVQTLGQFNTYAVPQTTITQGDFVIGFRITYPAGVFPTALDQTPPSQRRSLVSSDGSTFFIIDDVAPSLAGNFGIRAQLQSAGTVCCPTVSGLNPTSGMAGAQVTITGANFTGITAVKFAGGVAANFTANSDTQITATVPVGAITGPITISKTGCTDVQTAGFTVVPTCQTIMVTPVSLAAGTINTAYNQQLTATGGAPPYGFTLSMAALPNGLTLSASGALSGTPTQTGTFNITVKATDATGCMGTQSYSLVINCPTITLSPATLPGGMVGTAYNQTVSASPAGNYGYAVTAGALPSNLSLNATTGAITGTPTSAGTANFTITATGAGNCTGSLAYSITIQPACPVANTINPTTGTVGTQVTITGANFTGVTGVKFAGNAAANFTVNSDTQITTTVPSGAISGPVTISKTGCVDVQTSSFTVITCPTVTNVSPTTAAAGAQLTVTGSGFTGVTTVRFAGNASAAFLVNSDTQITTTVPANALSGPITLVKSGCSDAQTPAITINTPRIVRVVNISGAPGSPVGVAIEFVSQGDENALAFSLTFDPAVLSNPQTALGSDAAGGQVSVNTTQTVQGRLGLLVSLASGQRFSAGVRRVAVVTFTVAANAAAGTTPVGFGDQPISREVTNDAAGVLPANYTGGTVTVIHGYEADVSPRPTGNNNGQVTISDWVLTGRFVAGLDTVAVGSEFQRADCAPRDTLGDGRISLPDYVQAGRYAAGLDPAVPAGGPTAPVPGLRPESLIADCGSRIADQVTSSSCKPASVNRQLALSNVGRNPQSSKVRLVQDSLAIDGSLLIALDAAGTENALAFSLRFDSLAWRFISALATNDALGAQLYVNSTEAGRLGILLALPTGNTFAAGERRVLRINFAPFLDAHATTGAFGFADSPVQRAVVSVKAEPIAATYVIADNGLVARAMTVAAAEDVNRDDVMSGAFAVAYGEGLAVTSELADLSALPDELAGTRATVRDSAGTELAARLLFVSPSQVNFQLPADCAPGLATVTIASGEETISLGTLRINAEAAKPPSDALIAAVLVQHQGTDGRKWTKPLEAGWDASGKLVRDEPDSLVIIGRQLRAANVRVIAGGEMLAASFTEPAIAGDSNGLQQMHVRLPSGYSGRDEKGIVLMMDRGAGGARKIRIQ